MPKKLLATLASAGLLFGAPLAVLATGDLHYNTDTTVTVGSFTLTIVGGSDASQVIIGDSGTMTVVVPSAHTLTLSIPTGSLSTSPTAVEQSCGTPNSVALIGPGSFIVTPSSAACTKASTVVVAAPSTAKPATSTQTPTTTTEKKTETTKSFTFEEPKEIAAPSKPSTPSATDSGSSVTAKQAPTVAERAEQLVAIKQETTDIVAVIEDISNKTKVGPLTKEEKLSVLDEAPKQEVLSVIDRVIPSTVTRATAAVAIKFIADGTETTQHLGAGQRAAAINSYKAAFGTYPDKAAAWEDLIKIANGRFPSKTNKTIEQRAERSFQSIYKRAPNRKNQNDDAAVVVMAYGLQQPARNLKSEATAQQTYQRIFKRAPKGAFAWQAVWSIAYSGAKR